MTLDISPVLWRCIRTVLEKHPSADTATRQYGLFCALFLRVKILFGFLLGYKCIY